MRKLKPESKKKLQANNGALLKVVMSGTSKSSNTAGNRAQTSPKKVDNKEVIMRAVDEATERLQRKKLSEGEQEMGKTILRYVGFTERLKRYKATPLNTDAYKKHLAFLEGALEHYDQEIDKFEAKLAEIRSGNIWGKK